jgi:hypothetical protein
MADFALWATAAEQGIGLDKGAFMNAYTQNREDAHAIVLEDSSIFEAIQKICEKHAKFDGTMKDFLELIDTYADDKTRKSSSYPKSARGLRSQLERINPNLRQIGINITFPKRTKTGSQVLLAYDCKQPSPSSPQSPSRQNKAQNDDGHETTANTHKPTTITNAENGDGRNVQDDDRSISYQSTITKTKINNNNGLRAEDEGDDGYDGHLHSYSNNDDKTEFVDMEI